MNEAEVIDLLKSLGDIPEAVRASLKAQGITGKTGKSSTCPVAKFLQKHGASECTVGTFYIHPNDNLTIATPDAIYNFILNFDQGAYPELKELS